MGRNLYALYEDALEEYAREKAMEEFGENFEEKIPEGGISKEEFLSNLSPVEMKYLAAVPESVQKILFKVFRIHE